MGVKSKSEMEGILSQKTQLALLVLYSTVRELCLGESWNKTAIEVVNYTVTRYSNVVSIGVVESSIINDLYTIH